MRQHTQSHVLYRRLLDVVILLFLAAVAWLTARNYVLNDLIAWGDHPGQFMRFWYPAAVSLPKYGRLVDWNPLWYAGYPELQFYPPGHALTGIALNALTLGLLPLERVYNLIPAIALVLPIFTTFIFLRVALAPLGRLASQAAGLVGAFLALSFTPMWGGTLAVLIGLLGERLAFGVVPLALLAGWKLVERPTGPRLTFAAGLLALLILLHPFHSPAVVIAVAGYAVLRWLQQRDLHAEPAERPRWPWLAGWLFLAAGLTAWWLLPLLARQTPYAAALTRATLAQTLDWFRIRPVVPSLFVAATPALALLAHREWRVRACVGVLAAMIPVLVILILLDHVVLINWLHITTLDPIRFVAEYYMAFILLTGAAAGAIVSLLRRRTLLLAIGLMALMVVALRPMAVMAWKQVQEYTAWPVGLAKDVFLQRPAFKGLWEALRDDPAADGRVLFTSYYLQVGWPDGNMVPTAIKAMTPYLTGREIVGGTFSHWSPGARLLWVGDPWVRVLPAQVEVEDDQRILGIPWNQISDATLYATLQALNVTTIVTDENDVNARAMLDAAPHFQRFWENGYFTLYHLLDAAPAWVEGDGATVQLIERSARRWVIQVDQASDGANLTAKMTYYPLWRAETDGQRLPITANQYGMQQIQLPAGGPYTVSLTYREGWPEWGGFITTVGALIVSLLLLRRSHKQQDTAS